MIIALALMVIPCNPLVNNFLQNNKGKIHFQTPLVNLIQDNEIIIQTIPKQQLLNQNAISHINNARTFPPFTLHSNLISNITTQLNTPLG
jgi:hypothetical protein